MLRPGAGGPNGSPNVVPIRPGALNVLAPPPEGANPAPDEEQIVELSSQERDAFREIARALGARVRPPREFDAGDEPTGAALPQDGEPEASDVAALVAPAEAEAALHRPLAAAPARDDVAALVDELPIGALVVRGGEALYANRTLLDFAGFATREAFCAGDGVKQIFRGTRSRGAAGERRGIASGRGRRRTRDGARPVATDLLARRAGDLDRHASLARRRASGAIALGRA